MTGRISTMLSLWIITKEVVMKIDTPKMSEFLLEEFMKPLNVSAYKLAKAVNVPVSRIQEILHVTASLTPRCPIIGLNS